MLADRELDALCGPETGAALLDGERAPPGRFAIEQKVGAAHLGQHAIESALLRESLGLDRDHHASRRRARARKLETPPGVAARRRSRL